MIGLISVVNWIFEPVSSNVKELLRKPIWFVFHSNGDIQTTEVVRPCFLLLESGNVVRQGNVFEERLFEMHITGCIMFHFQKISSYTTTILLLTKDLIQYVSLSRALFFLFVNLIFLFLFFLFVCMCEYQDLKNQILTTNVWVEHVSIKCIFYILIPLWTSLSDMGCGCPIWYRVSISSGGRGGDRFLLLQHRQAVGECFIVVGCIWMCDAVQPAQQLASKQKGIHVQIKGRNSIGKQTLAKCVCIYVYSTTQQWDCPGSSVHFLVKYSRQV